MRRKNLAQEMYRDISEGKYDDIIPNLEDRKSFAEDAKNASSAYKKVLETYQKYPEKRAELTSFDLGTKVIDQSNISKTQSFGQPFGQDPFSKTTTDEIKKEATDTRSGLRPKKPTLPKPITVKKQTENDVLKKALEILKEEYEAKISEDFIINGGFQKSIAKKPTFQKFFENVTKLSKGVGSEMIRGAALTPAFEFMNPSNLGPAETTPEYDLEMGRISMDEFMKRLKAEGRL